MTRLSVCIEMLFAPEHPDVAARIAAVRACGLDLVEFWSWRNKDLGAIERAMGESGVGAAGFLVDPRRPIVDPATHDDFVASVRETLPVARRLGAEVLIVVTGDARAGVPHGIQLAAIADALKLAAPLAEDAGVTLVLEPLNTAKDHVGYFLDDTVAGLDIVEQVASPSVKLLYDLYHSVMMGEDPAAVLGDRGGLIGHLHVADAPGRQEPGTGAIDFSRALQAVRHAGYHGTVGLEFRPSGTSEAGIAAARARLDPQA